MVWGVGVRGKAVWAGGVLPPVHSHPQHLSYGAGATGSSIRTLVAGGPLGGRGGGGGGRGG